MLMLCAASVGGCDDDTGFSGPKILDMASNAIPTPPTLGAEIDRMGRAAINTALNNTFNPNDGTNGTSDQRGAAKDAYNAEGNQANWAKLMLNGKLVTAEFAGNLAIIDALDGKCGNQLLATGGGGDAGALGYAAAAGLLVDDQLYVDTTKMDCKPITMVGGTPLPNYLAVEARAIQLPFPTCGGRTPLDDVIDISYTLLASGLDLTPVSDGVPKDADPAMDASLTDFPFLNAPNM
jgi:hypothetical protein